LCLVFIRHVLYSQGRVLARRSLFRDETSPTARPYVQLRGLRRPQVSLANEALLSPFTALLLG
jgi:hypothetical protein